MDAKKYYRLMSIYYPACEVVKSADTFTLIEAQRQVRKMKQSGLDKYYSYTIIPIGKGV